MKIAAYILFFLFCVAIIMFSYPLLCNASDWFFGGSHKREIFTLFHYFMKTKVRSSFTGDRITPANYVIHYVRRLFAAVVILILSALLYLFILEYILKIKLYPNENNNK